MKGKRNGSATKSLILEITFSELLIFLPNFFKLKITCNEVLVPGLHDELAPNWVDGILIFWSHWADNVIFADKLINF